MTIHNIQNKRVLQQQQAEVNYIDSMLEGSSNLKTENETVALKAVKPPADYDLAAENNLYQLVSVAGLKLAILLAEITQVVDHRNSVIEQDVLLHDGDSLSIVDIESLIKPDEHTDVTAADEQQYLLIKHRKLAIKCQKILDIETINKEVVCWRNENSQRKWLAGTIKQQGVAILDLSELQKLLVNE